jgi:hypothetical protein
MTSAHVRAQVGGGGAERVSPFALAPLAATAGLRSDAGGRR